MHVHCITKSQRILENIFGIPWTHYKQNSIKINLWENLAKIIFILEFD